MKTQQLTTKKAKNNKRYEMGYKTITEKPSSVWEPRQNK